MSKSARPTEKSGKEGKRGQGFRLLDALEGINGKPNEKMQQTSKKQPAEWKKLMIRMYKISCSHIVNQEWSEHVKKPHKTWVRNNMKLIKINNS